MRVGGSDRFVKRPVGPRKYDFGHETEIAQLGERAIYRGESKTRLALRCQVVDLGHREMHAGALTVHDFVHEPVVFRQMRGARRLHSAPIVAQGFPAEKRG